MMMMIYRRSTDLPIMISSMRLLPMEEDLVQVYSSRRIRLVLRGKGGDGDNHSVEL